ncbi:MAG: cell division protein FtsZ [Rickettsiales bacterium]
MAININIPTQAEHLRPTITVIGVGGAGGNAVNNMIASALEGVNFVVANTDAQALDRSLAERTIQLGAGITKGLGAGANPSVGRDAAEEAGEEIASHIEGSNMVFITAGMGGGTGTGAASVVARIAKEQGILTVAVVTKPFQFEGRHRMNLAESGLKELQDYVDTLIVIPNQNLFRIANEHTTFADAFKMADEVLHSGVRGVTDLMVKPGLINLDFADIRTVMLEMGKAMMGTGEATGEHRAVEAAEAAISNPLLDDVSLKGAKALLVNVTGGLDMTLFEVDEALNRVRDEVDPDANIIFGSTFNESSDGKMRVSVVATGIDALKENNPIGNKSSGATEARKPYSFNAPIKSEPIKAAQKVAPINSVSSGTQSPIRQQFEQISGGAAARFDKTDNVRDVAKKEEHVGDVVSSELNDNSKVKPLLNEPINIPQAVETAVASSEVETVIKATPSMINQREHTSAMREAASSARGFLRKMAEAGKSLSNRYSDDEYVEKEEPRVQIVQRTNPQNSSEERSRTQDDDQYLDIPAFLRRQAN